MAKHHPDLIFCRKQAGVAIGRLCEKCDGKCVICDSYVRPCTLVRICDECNYGSYQGRCVICGGPGVSDAYYCKECTIQEKDVSIFTQEASSLSLRPLEGRHILCFSH
uniref:PHD finger protein 5A n=1 Tax=Saimiri boliviensis boliviensis TaxID=39432 RepID=A0A2K6TB42_SAIBB